MDGKNNVWIVKLNPSGGLLTKKEYNKWQQIPELGQKLKNFTKEEIMKYQKKYKKKKLQICVKKRE